jgi:hypothetical protein
MKTVSEALTSLLNNTVDKFYPADLFIITLANSGTVLRYTSHDTDLIVGSNRYYSKNIGRKGTKISVGTSVDELEVDIYPDDNWVVDGVPIIEALQNGVLDGAYLQLDRVFASSAWNVSLNFDEIENVDTVANIDFPSGPFIPSISSDYVLEKLFLGRVDAPEIYSTSAQLKAKSLMQLLNINMPRNLIQSTCGNTLYDSVCGLTRSSYAVTSSVTSTSTATIIYASGLTQTAGYFNQGVIQFTSGLNSGLKRTVKTHASGGVLTMILYFPSAPAIGDTFTIVPGCDKTMATCKNTFNNLANYRGMPYVPLPETTI